MTSRIRDYKPYTRKGREEHHVNAVNGMVDWRKDPNLPPINDTYGFIISPSTMVREFNELGDVVKWPPMKHKPKANPESKLWCDFHGDYDHRAFDFVALRREIQALIKKRYLVEFMSSQKSDHVRRDRTSPRQPPSPPHHKVINFTTGGSEVCGSTYSKAKRAARVIGVRVAKTDIMKD